MKIEEKIKLKKSKKKTLFPITKFHKKIDINIKRLDAILILIIILLIVIIFFLIINKKKYIEPKNQKNKPKIIAITYSNGVFERQADLNKKSALEVGKVDEHYSFGPDDIDQEFKEKNKEILSKFRGGGYWLWKPYIILKTFKEKLREGDYLIYADAGVLYMNSTYLLIDFLKEQNAEMWMNRIFLKESAFSKRDAFILMGVDMPFYSETYQYIAAFQIYRKSKYTEKFLEELLFYSQDIRIISDNPNKLGVDNYQGFKENRHDQTVLSLLVKKYGQSNSGNPTLNPDDINNGKHIYMPNIFCIYRRIAFKDYDDLKEKCKDIIERQTKIFSI